MLPALQSVATLRETAWYVELMPGGVRGGGREASPYSIFDICKFQELASTGVMARDQKF